LSQKLWKCYTSDDLFNIAWLDSAIDELKQMCCFSIVCTGESRLCTGSWKILVKKKGCGDNLGMPESRVMCQVLTPSSSCSVLVHLKRDRSRGSAESLESTAGVGVLGKWSSLFLWLGSLDTCNSKLGEDGLLKVVLVCSPQTIL